MKEKNYLYLKDDEFKTISFSDIPSKFIQLKDNPYRSLAYLAREEKCFKKVDTPFQEFIWAEFFYKENIRIEGSRIDKSPLKDALKLCKSNEARNLPGAL